MQSESETIKAVLGGDKTAYADLVRRYEGAVRAVALQVLGDLHSAEDASQDAFVKAYESLKSLRNGAAFGPWLLQIARRRALDMVRRRIETVPIAEHCHATVSTPEHEARLEEESKLLLDAVMRLPDHERTAILLRHFDGHSMRGIAALAVLAVVGKAPTPAYAIQDTIDAIDEIETVHFKAKFYIQGDVECWMKFDSESARPTHLSLFRPGHPIRTLDSPDGSFTYNERTNLVFPKVRDERGKTWYLEFASFFQQALQAAGENDSMRISSELDPKTQREVIVIDVDEGTRACRYYIDPDTKLPLRFTTTTTRDPREFMRMTIAVKSMDLIEYNLPIPEGMFDFPADAQTVTNEHDIIWHPGVGLLVDGLSPKEACVRLVRETMDAMNAYDFERVQLLLFPFIAPPDEVVRQIRAKAGGKPVVELLELGEPYEDGEYWRIRTKTKEFSGKTKDELVPVRFYEFESHTYCMVTWPD
jgi:RNA polymerase sigma-70 factor, ECF subfamily